MDPGPPHQSFLALQQSPRVTRQMLSLTSNSCSFRPPISPAVESVVSPEMRNTIKLITDHCDHAPFAHTAVKHSSLRGLVTTALLLLLNPQEPS